MKRLGIFCLLLALVLAVAVERVELAAENLDEYIDVSSNVDDCTLLGTEDIFGAGSKTYSGNGKIRVTAEGKVPGIYINTELEYYLDTGADWAFTAGNYVTAEGHNRKNGSLMLSGGRANEHLELMLNIKAPRLIAPDELEKAELVITAVRGTILKLK